MTDTKSTTANTTANPTIPQGPRVPDEGRETERTPAQTPKAPEPTKRVVDEDDDEDRDTDDVEAKRAKRIALKEKHQIW